MRRRRSPSGRTVEWEYCFAASVRSYGTVTSDIDPAFATDEQIRSMSYDTELEVDWESQDTPELIDTNRVELEL